ncbi:MAG TPA: hypothetical protein VFM70_07080 [Salinimicrobium sp.]|nr:hypothetical protein [Salinimicrobium sp.]
MTVSTINRGSFNNTVAVSRKNRDGLKKIWAVPTNKPRRLQEKTVTVSTNKPWRFQQMTVTVARKDRSGFNK